MMKRIAVLLLLSLLLSVSVLAGGPDTVSESTAASSQESAGIFQAPVDSSHVPAAKIQELSAKSQEPDALSRGSDAKKVSYLGPAGTYTEEAAQFWFRDGETLIPKETVDDAVADVLSLIGIPAQETMLGTYTVKGREKLVCACKDFTTGSKRFFDFCSIKNTVLDSDSNGTGTELADVMDAIDKQQYISYISAAYAWALKFDGWDNYNM